ncbi:MAG: fibronectin-binding domain-containing protein [Nitrospira sp. LK70]|nr:fibronectin-binding domain-containing protein [Nitrospira sp. LK70]
MALKADEIMQVVHEISPILRRGWFQKIHQPTARTLLFEVRVPGQTHRLLISCEPETARLHLASHSTPNPPTPPPFCQFLRAHFQGARIDDIHQVANDRIVEIQITGKEGSRTILCELTGKKANILVLDAERRVLRDLAGQRALVGQLYAPPATREIGQEKAPVRFSGIADSLFPISAEIEAFYQRQDAAREVAQAKDLRIRSLKKSLKKQVRLIEAWQNDLSRATAYRDYARYGELIKANLGAIAKGSELIEMTDYFDDSLPTITIPLDPMKSPQGNMDDYFRKHRKFLAAERELRPRIERAEQDLCRIRQELRDIEQGIWIPPAIPSSPLKARTIARSTRDQNQSTGAQRRGPFRRFTSTDGLPIFVGRNDRENDELTFGLAKSDDLWLHARGTPGSHVVVRLSKGTDPPPETLGDAAMLALLYSDLKKSGKGDVIYTRRKWVKKAKGQAPGTVVVTQEKSLHVSLDKTRLEALKNRAS